jgi:DNA polymerase-3 subunit alpha
MRLIEAYDTTDATVTIDGRSYPPVCLIEDDDGIRWFVTSWWYQVSPHYWTKAAAAGAVALVTPREGDEFYGITADEFMEQRTEVQGVYVPPQPPRLLSSGTFPTLASVLGSVTQDAGVTEPVAATTGFVHLHTHSEFSPLDGLSKMEEIVAQVTADGQQALGITDHGTCAGHPDLAKYAEKAGIKPIFGIEAYFCEDRIVRPKKKPEQRDFTKKVWQADTDDDGNKLSTGSMVDAPDEDAWRAAMEAHTAFQKSLKDDYFHLILWAETQEGLRNLWAMSTEAYRDGLYYRPRMDWDTLARHSTGVIASTACLRGPLSVPLLKGDEVTARARLARLMGIFGDRLYLELHANQLPEQKTLNETLVRLGKEYAVPVVAVVDSHYPTEHDHDAHHTWIACQTNSDINDEGDLFAVNLDLFVQSEKQVRAALDYLDPQTVDEAVGNTCVIADRCTATIKGKSNTPTFSRTGGAERDVERLLDLCMSNWERKTTGKRESQEVYMARFEREMGLLIPKEFCGYFLMVADYCKAAKEGRIDGHASGKLTGRPILVGPGRGSGGGSLVAYLADIVEIDAVDADLLFERFLTEDRIALPDFDVDFPASKKADLLSYVRERWGEDHVVTVGSILRLQNKGIVKDLGRAMASTLPEGAYVDLAQVAKIIDEAEAGTAGLGVEWEDLWHQEGERLDPYRQKYPDLFGMADRLVGRVKTYGKHAAGVVISTEEPLTDLLPLRGIEGEQMVTQFDKDVLEEALGLVKFDLLTLRTLDTIQMCVDLIRDQRGIEVNVYDWKDEYHDPQVWDEVSAAHTLGIFQIETTPGTQLTKKMQPRSVAELADMITLVRPGPKRSGLTDAYLRRRNGEEEVSFPDARLEKVLAKTYGTILYQEDVMAVVMVLAGYTGTEADKVRKILGKKQVEKIAAEGEKFIAQAAERGMDAVAAGALWAQMAEFAKYSFNRAHAFAYAILGYWCAWLKFHYPVQFLTAALSSVDKDRIPDFIKEARRMGYAVQPPDINESKVGFVGSPLAVRYGLDSLKGIAGAAQHIMDAQPFTSFEDFMTRLVEPKGSKVNLGHVAILSRIGAFDSLVPNRRGLEALVLAKKDGTDTQCVDKDTSFVGPNGLPCHFDWASEPPPLGRTGKPLKAKPIPKKCSRACRQYRPTQTVTIDKIEPYNEEAIREIEHELLGVYLTSTPFDRLPERERDICFQQLEALLDERSPNNIYLIAAIVSSVRARPDRNGNKMAFASLTTEMTDIDCVVFSKTWARYNPEMKPGTLALVEVEKTPRGYTLVSFMAY